MPQLRQKATISDLFAHLVGWILPMAWGGGKYPTREWADPVLRLGRAIQCPQHRTGDRGGGVAAAEFARFEAFGKGAVNGVLDRAGSVCGPGVIMAFGEPIEH